MDAVVTHVGYPKPGVMEGYQRCDLKIDGLKYDGVLMSQPVYEYLTKTEGKTKNKLWIQKTKAGFVMSAIETESGEKHVVQPRTSEYFHGLLQGLIAGIVLGGGMMIWLHSEEAFWGTAIVVTGLVWYKIQKKVGNSLDLSTYEQGTSADLGTKAFGLS
ncbi:MAG: hypothetical protein ACOH2P_19080 [Pseudomonas sp.]|uniref:hypothetical protein n=1 Tax=Pseudomonas frederiksbergensis TaxID=104087 RepID=UPI003D20D25A